MTWFDSILSMPARGRSGSISRFFSKRPWLFFQVKERISRLSKITGGLSLLGSIWLIHAGMLSAGVVEVTEFSQISGAQFYDAPASNSVNPVTVGTVIVTPSVSLLNESFAGANAPQYGPNVPGNGAGFGSDSSGFGGATPLMLNFSEPVAAFGATFVHFENTRHGSSYESQVSIQLFSGLDGTGTLLGRIVDSWEGVATQQPAFANFRGLWSDRTQVRSAEISASYPQSGGFQVDGYALSVDPMPIPEPLILVLSGTGLIGLGIAWRHAKK